MISPDLVFLMLAGIAFLGFVFDSLFHRLRITSMLPLMLIGVAIVQFHILPPGTLSFVTLFLPYVSALTIAFILFSVGLEIRVSDLSKVLGRASAYTIGVQTLTGVLLAMFAFYAFHWPVLVDIIFGFGLSGPSSVSVPALVKVARLPGPLGTALLYESVLSDLLQLIVPLTVATILISGKFSAMFIGESLALTILGSSVAGVVAALIWLWVLDRIRSASRGYTWTLTITMVLATYAIADLVGFSSAITIFIFGLFLGNASRLHRERTTEDIVPMQRTPRSLLELRKYLGIATLGLDIPDVQQVQREVSFFTSAFFFVYLGLLFEVSQLTLFLVLIPLVASVVMLGCRVAGLPLLDPYMEGDGEARRSQRSLVAFNIPRGLAAAIIATLPLSIGLVVPGFLDAMFLGILFSAIVSTIGIFALYTRMPSGPVEEEKEGARVTEVSAVPLSSESGRGERSGTGREPAGSSASSSMSTASPATPAAPLESRSSPSVDAANASALPPEQRPPLPRRPTR